MIIGKAAQRVMWAMWQADDPDALPRRRSGARLGDGLSAVVWSLAESWLGVASYLDRVLLVMDTPPVYRVPLQFGQLMMTPLYRVMVVSWLSVLAVAMPVLRLSYSKLEH